jgi:hypothetical protein
MQDKGHSFALYRYHVPVSTSHYQFLAGPRPEDLVTLAYEGRFWVDSHEPLLLDEHFVAEWKTASGAQSE